MFIREVSGGGLVLPSQITHAYQALVYFEPPLSYLIAGLGPGESRTFDGRMDVYSVNNPALKWYTPAEFARRPCTPGFTGSRRRPAPSARR